MREVGTFKKILCNAGNKNNGVSKMMITVENQLF